MAISKESHQELFDVGAVAGLLNCAKSNDLQTRRCCAFAFNNIAANMANHAAAEVNQMKLILIAYFYDNCI